MTEFVAALGIWFVFPQVLEFQSHLVDFPRFWLQLESSGGKSGVGGAEGGGVKREYRRQSWSVSHTTQHSWGSEEEEEE